MTRVENNEDSLIIFIDRMGKRLLRCGVCRKCLRCGVRVEDFPWAAPWARVTRGLSNAVARLARELSWQGTARQYGLNWKTVAGIVKRAVGYGLRNRKRPPVHLIGIDEVSRRKGQVYLTVVYDLERGVLFG